MFKFIESECGVVVAQDWAGAKGNCGLSIFIHATLNTESQSGVEKAKALVATFLSVLVWGLPWWLRQ